MSSAQLDPRHALDHEEHEGDDAFALTEYPALKQEVAARLAAHRARRQRNAPAAPAPIPIATTPARARAAKIAAAVAERYAQSASYREFLANEAESAIRQAEAAAEVAVVTARAVAEAQLNLLEELDQYKQDVAADAPQAKAIPALETVTAKTRQPDADDSVLLQFQPETVAGAAQTTVAAVAVPKVTVRLYEEVAPVVPQEFTTSHLSITMDPFGDEGLALDDEIAFRQAPTFAESSQATEIPANLIEFPRQLVAARRARPRLAEGPLREDAELEHDSAQLRIFEVEPAQMSSEFAVASSAPEWSSILLDAQPVIAPTMVEAEEPATLQAEMQPLLQTAPLELRAMAAAVDTAIVLGGMLVFGTAAVFAAGSVAVPHLVAPTSLAGLREFAAEILPIGLSVAFVFVFLTTLYQYLFFTFSDATPGMRYARIGLCTFSDENPTRAEMRRRIPATLLSLCPLGLGLLWSWIDTDRIGWHDRISRTYQRSY